MFSLTKFNLILNIILNLIFNLILNMLTVQQVLYLNYTAMTFSH